MSDKELIVRGLKLIARILFSLIQRHYPSEPLSKLSDRTQKELSMLTELETLFNSQSSHIDEAEQDDEIHSLRKAFYDKYIDISNDGKVIFTEVGYNYDSKSEAKRIRSKHYIDYIVLSFGKGIMPTLRIRRTGIICKWTNHKDYNPDTTEFDEKLIYLKQKGVF